MATPANALEISDLWVNYDDVTAVHGVSFDLAPTKHLTLLGPSGCGKSTILRSIAGLEQPTKGSIRLFGEAVFDAERGTNIPTQDRNLSMVFQSYAVWPHMTVFDNVAYGLRLRRFSAQEIQSRVMQALELVGLQDLAHRPAPNLSGGQQQRVALARSFVFNPRIILFDEPLSNLDAQLRIQMREELKALQTKLGVTSIFVTHDQEEALVMSDKVIVLRSGVIEQAGAPFDVYYRPRTRFVADFVGGSNIVPVVRAEKAGAGLRLSLSDDRHLVSSVENEAGSAVAEAAIKTTHISLTETQPASENAFRVDVVSRSFAGDFVLYEVRWGETTLFVRSPSDHVYEAGQALFAVIDPKYVVPLARE